MALEPFQRVQRAADIEFQDFKPGSHTQGLQILPDQFCRAARGFHEIDVRRTAADGLDTDRSGTGIKIEPNRTSQCIGIARGQYIEQRLTQAVASRARIHARERRRNPRAEMLLKPFAPESLVGRTAA